MVTSISASAQAKPGSQLSPRKGAPGTKRPPRRKSTAVGRGKGTARQRQISEEETARAREETHKLRRNCKNPAVAKRGLRGERQQRWQHEGKTRREEKQCEHFDSPDCTAHGGAPSRPLPRPQGRRHPLGAAQPSADSTAAPWPLDRLPARAACPPAPGWSSGKPCSCSAACGRIQGRPLCQDPVFQPLLSTSLIRDLGHVILLPELCFLIRIRRSLRPLPANPL